ncbi:CRISPR-associated helicase Cas3' [Nesterenkonia halophila]|uniref:CRISPR-associated helicase Cas3' n=1 Tax=Nesterenkonia halophila TaxID=302044 RepID=UPI0014793C7A|nr:CRISPR-associated helicase Cas3' [Nesterenkonia halophila]
MGTMPGATDTAWPCLGWSLWAKSGDELGWLSLPQHMRDSARIAGLLWDDWVAPGVKHRVRDDLRVADDAMRTVVMWLAGSHDVGKADPLFIDVLAEQPEFSHLADKAYDAGLPRHTHPQFQTKLPHSHISFVAISRYLRLQARMQGPVTKRFASIAGAHHGLPPAHTQVTHASDHVNHLPEAWQTLQSDLLEALSQETSFDEVILQLRRCTLQTSVQMVLTGLVIMTDWIASNAEACPMTLSGQDDGPNRARTALASVNPGLPWRPEPPEVDSAAAFASRFHWPEGRTAHPAQRAAVELASSVRDGDGALLTIEAPMGQGKTEAALLATEILARRSGAGGVMVAAPTMATADGLLQRVAAWGRDAVATDTPASLFLGHSKSHLNTTFRRLPRFRDIEDDRTGQVLAHDWLRGRKKGILANLVVGTVDQVLFSALLSKHMMLRHLGLAQKVVVIDEVHAYDTYMSQYLQRALTWLGEYRAPVVLLSATLPASRRRELIDAYRRGLDPDAAPSAGPDTGGHYPILTLTTDEGTTTASTESDPTNQHVELDLLDDDEEALREALRPLVEDGGCAAVVCSTVDRAQETYRLARELVGDDARLLHSRFMASQRVRMEAELFDELGPKSTRDDGRPRRRIVVATQVIEQSLDLDFDLLITDIAPSDLILQRMGRLHRHARPHGERPEWAEHPRTLIRGYTRLPAAETAPDFVETIELIYPRALLLASTSALRLEHGAGEVTIPPDIPGLVDRTYENPDVPDAWRDDFDQARAEHDADEQESARRAQAFRLPEPWQSQTLTDLFQAPAGDIDRDSWGEERGMAQVRDTDPTVEVLLVKKGIHGYRPFDPDTAGSGSDFEIMPEAVPEDHQAHTIAASSVRLPRAFSRPDRFNAALDQLETETDPAWHHSFTLKGQLMLALDEANQAVLADRCLEYDPELGLIDHSRTAPDPQE